MPLTLPLVGHGLRRQVEEVLLRAVVHKYNAPQCHDAQRLIKKKNWTAQNSRFASSNKYTRRRRRIARDILQLSLVKNARCHTTTI